MTTIEKYISDLLHFHDCVIVPGLGGFVANYKPAIIMEERNLFLPPSKEIGFNRSLAHSDGLLIDFISRCEAISYADASVKVQRFVESVQASIATGDYFDLGDVGLLRRDAIGNMLFTPKDGSSFLPEALGLSSFRFKTLEAQKGTRLDVENVPHLLRSRSPRYWAAAAALIAGLFLFNTELKTPSINEAGMGNFIPTPTAMVAVNSDKSEPAEESIDEKSSISTPLQSESADINTSEPTLNVSKYHVIVGSFKSANPANKTLNDFISQGFTQAKLIDDAQGRIRIAISSFSNKQDAIDALIDYKKQPRFNGAWVLTSK